VRCTSYGPSWPFVLLSFNFLFLCVVLKIAHCNANTYKDLCKISTRATFWLRPMGEARSRAVSFVVAHSWIPDRVRNDNIETHLRSSAFICGPGIEQQKGSGFLFCCSPFSPIAFPPVAGGEVKVPVLFLSLIRMHGAGRHIQAVQRRFFGARRRNHRITPRYRTSQLPAGDPTPAARSRCDFHSTVKTRDLHAEFRRSWPVTRASFWIPACAGMTESDRRASRGNPRLLN